MNVSMRANVECQEGHCGRITSIVVERLTRKITHIVVREPGPGGSDRLVSGEEVSSANRSAVVLRTSRARIAQMPPAQAKIPTLSLVYTGSEFAARETSWEFRPSCSTRGRRKIKLSVFDAASRKNTKSDEVAAATFVRVEAINGTVGWLLELIVNPTTMVVTDFVMCEGNVWDQREIIIPVDAIDYIRNGVIHVGLFKHQIKDLASMSE
jgi:hypothetical protein